MARVGWKNWADTPPDVSVVMIMIAGQAEPYISRVADISQNYNRAALWWYPYGEEKEDAGINAQCASSGSTKPNGGTMELTDAHRRLSEAVGLTDEQKQKYTAFLASLEVEPRRGDNQLSSAPGAQVAAKPDALDRIAASLENIAGSLAKLVNPPMPAWPPIAPRANPQDRWDQSRVAPHRESPSAVADVQAHGLAAHGLAAQRLNESAEAQAPMSARAEDKWDQWRTVCRVIDPVTGAWTVVPGSIPGTDS
jgi:hypothetical protein